MVKFLRKIEKIIKKNKKDSKKMILKIKKIKKEIKNNLKKWFLKKINKRPNYFRVNLAFLLAVANVLSPAYLTVKL